MRPRRRRWLLWLWLATCCVPLAAYHEHAGAYLEIHGLYVGVDSGCLTFRVIYLISNPHTLNHIGWDHTGERGPIQWLPSFDTSISGFLGMKNSYVYVPAWLISAISIGSGLLFRRLTRPRHSGCPGCGYNLTGNVSGICPECGRALPRSTAATPAAVQK